MRREISLLAPKLRDGPACQACSRGPPEDMSLVASTRKLGPALSRDTPRQAQAQSLPSQRAWRTGVIVPSNAWQKAPRVHAKTVIWFYAKIASIQRSEDLVFMPLSFHLLLPPGLPFQTTSTPPSLTRCLLCSCDSKLECLVSPCRVARRHVSLTLEHSLYSLVNVHMDEIAGLTRSIRTTVQKVCR